jgi:hypothetical protein
MILSIPYIFLLLHYGFQILKLKVSHIRNAEWRDAALMTVRYADQALGAFEKSEKKEIVESLLLQRYPNIPKEVLDTLIESAVKEMKETPTP